MVLAASGVFKSDGGKVGGQSRPWFQPEKRPEAASQIGVTGYDADKTETLPPLEFGYSSFEPEKRAFFPIRGADLPEALRLAEQAARQGMLDTIPLVARKGRASYLGERSAGHQDPGATSAYFLIKAAADSLCE